MAHYKGRRFSCSCPDGTCDMNCRLYRSAAGKPSNADRIRGMTDEELAEFMANNVGCDDCRFFATCRSAPQDRACAEKWLDWLKQEASE